jgi:hypothetical protein
MILILCWNSAEYREQSIRRKKEEACHGWRSVLNGPFLNRWLWRSNHEQAELHPLPCTAEFSFMRLTANDIAHLGWKQHRRRKIISSSPLLKVKRGSLSRKKALRPMVAATDDEHE